MNVRQTRAQKSAAVRRSEMQERLAAEAHQVLYDALRAFGVTRAQQLKASGGPQKGKGKTPRAKRPSTLVLERYHVQGDVVTLWKRDKRYSDPQGRPISLALTGPGPTFEKLVRQVTRREPAGDLLKGLCESGEVVVTKDGKLVLVGSSVVIYPKFPEVMLAEFVSQLRYLSGTIIHNAKLSSNKKGSGRFQQAVYGRLSDRAFKKYCLGVRTSLQETCTTAQKPFLKGDRSETAGKGAVSGVGIYVFRDDGDDG